MKKKIDVNDIEISRSSFSQFKLIVISWNDKFFTFRYNSEMLKDMDLDEDLKLTISHGLRYFLGRNFETDNEYQMEILHIFNTIKERYF